MVAANMRDMRERRHRKALRAATERENARTTRPRNTREAHAIMRKRRAYVRQCQRTKAQVENQCTRAAAHMSAGESGACENPRREAQK